SQEELRRTLYAARVNLVQNAWEADNIARVRDLLEQLLPRKGERDLRGFEWHYWYRLSHAEVRTLDLGAQYLSEAAFSPDGTRFAAILRPPLPNKPLSFKWEVRVWDTATGKELLTLKDAAGWVDNLAFSPDGKRLAARTGPGVKVWDADTGKALPAVQSSGSISQVVFGPDSRRL